MSFRVFDVQATATPGIWLTFKKVKVQVQKVLIGPTPYADEIKRQISKLLGPSQGRKINFSDLLTNKSVHLCIVFSFLIRCSSFPTSLTLNCCLALIFHYHRFSLYRHKHLYSQYTPTITISRSPVKLKYDC